MGWFSSFRRLIPSSFAAFARLPPLLFKSRQDRSAAPRQFEFLVLRQLELPIG
jgi:hypothetical protein